MPTEDIQLILFNKLKLFFSLFSIVLVSLLTVSCGQKTFENEHESIKKISASSILNSNLSDADKANELADAAEILLNADGFSQANEYSAMALEIDKNHFKAGAIKVFTDLMQSLKGIAIKVQPFFMKFESGKSFYIENFENLKESAKFSEIYAYMLQGRPEFSSEAEIQNYLDKVAISLENLRQFAKKNKDNPLTIKAHSLLFRKELVERYVEACEIKRVDSDNTYEVVCPENRVKSEIQLNRADFEVIQQYSAAKMIELAIFTSYDLSGYSDTFKDRQAVASTHPQNIYSQLIENKNFGVLRKSNTLNLVQSMGLDILSSIDWASSNQLSLCPNGEDSYHNRLGMLFNLGICIRPMFNNLYQSFAMKTLTNKPESIMLKVNSTDYEAQFNYGKLLSEPIKDMRSLGMKFDACGNIIEVEDQGFGALFPNKDANVVLPLTNKACNL